MPYEQEAGLDTCMHIDHNDVFALIVFCKEIGAFDHTGK